MSRFVILFHDCPSNHPRPSHCDLMLEHAGKLRTWALSQLPHDWIQYTTDSSTVKPALLAFATTNDIDADQLADHRLAYLDYEGPVSGDRGNVVRLDAGQFDTLLESPDLWQIALQGDAIRGEITLRREADKKWRLTFLPMPPSKE